MKKEGLHYRKFPRFVVHWKGNNKKKVLDFCKGAARIEGGSVFINDTTETKKGEFIVNIKGTHFWTANPRELKCLTRMRKIRKCRKYPVDIHSLNVWARYLRKNRETWVELL